MADAVARANALFVDAEYELALSQYDAAVAAMPASADALSKRAAAHLKLGNHTKALADTTASLKLEPTLKAYWRKGAACFALQEFEAARSAFASAATLSPASKELKRWVRKCDAEMDSETGALTVSVPAAAATPGTSSAPLPAPPPSTDGSKLRHEWYQTATHVVVSILARGVAKDAVSVDFGDARCDVCITLSGGSEYKLGLGLFQKVEPAECKYSVGGVKVELKLKKQTPGKWAALEGSGDADEVQMTAGAQMNAAPVPAAAEEEGEGAAMKPRSVYSGSSRNWDAIEGDLKLKEEEEKPEGEEALNKLFRDIYGKADEETRRAMNKSFQTSGGTVLSTNWGEVKVKDYEQEKTAPDEQEWKKWG